MNDNVVTVELYQFLPEAELARVLLEAEGIQTFLAEAETVGTQWALGNAVGYIKLQVRASDANGAKIILDRIRNLKLEREARADDSGPGRCLACAAPLPANQATCSQCGWSYDGRVNPGG